MLKDEARKWASRNKRGTSQASRGTSPFTRATGPTIDIIDAEVDKYLSIEDDISIDLSQYQDWIAFWRDHERTYPGVASLARRILCINASSAACERLFSMLKLHGSVFRGKLKPEKLRKLVIFVALEMYEKFKRDNPTWINLFCFVKNYWYNKFKYYVYPQINVFSLFHGIFRTNLINFHYNGINSIIMELDSIIMELIPI